MRYLDKKLHLNKTELSKTVATINAPAWILNAIKKAALDIYLYGQAYKLVFLMKFQVFFYFAKLITNNMFGRFVFVIYLDLALSD